MKKTKQIKCNICLDYCGKTAHDCTIDLYDKLIASLSAERNSCTENPFFEYYASGSSSKRYSERILDVIANGEILMLNAKKWETIESRIQFLNACKISLIQSRRKCK